MTTVALLLLFTGPWLVYLFCPVPDQLAEYRNYSMNIGFALLFASLPWPFWFPLMLYLATMAHVHAMAWQNFTTMWMCAKDHASGDKSRAYQEIGAWLKVSGKPLEAEPWFRKAIKLNPKLGPAMENLAMVCVDTNRLDEGIQLLETMVERAPRYASGRQMLGMAYEHLGKFEEARSEFHTAMALKAMPESANRLGLMAWRDGKLDEALMWFEKALETQPNHSEFVYNAFTALDKLQRSTEAQELKKRLKGPIPLTPNMIRPEGLPC